MINAQTASRVLPAFATFLGDIGAGALASAQLAVTFVGCAALLAGGVLMSSETARELAMAKLPSQPVLAMPISVPEVQVEATPVRMDDPRQKRIVQYLARRYKVADEAVRQLVSAAFAIGREKNLDPLLILSIVAIESSLNPFAQSAMGAQGLMQVMTRVHAQRFQPHGGETAALDPIANMKVGSSILHESISRGGSVERGLQLYVGAGNLPDDGGYGVRVLGERSRLELAASGKVDAAITSGIRAAAPPPPVADPARPSTPAGAEAQAPLEPTFLLPLPKSTADEPPAARTEHSV